MEEESSSSSSSSSDFSDEESSNASEKYHPVCRPNSKISRPAMTTFCNNFKNDGSFLEMFKKMQEQNIKNENSNEKSNEATNTGNNNSSSSTENALSSNSSGEKINKTTRPVAKRRAAKVLPTGLVKKQRKDGQPVEEETKKEQRKNDPWSKYMDEVKKYKQQSCTDDNSSRTPLVK